MDAHHNPTLEELKVAWYDAFRVKQLAEVRLQQLQAQIQKMERAQPLVKKAEVA